MKTRIGLGARIRSLSGLKKLGLLFVLLVAVYTAVGFLVLPPVFKMILKNRLSSALNRNVTVEAVRVNPYALSFNIRGLDVRKEGAEHAFFRFDELHVNVQAVSLIDKALVVKRLTLIGPGLTLVRTGRQRFNFSDLLDRNRPSGSSEASGSSGIRRFSINNIQIRDGRIRLQDLFRHGAQNIDDLNLDIPFLSNMRSDVNVWVHPDFSARINGSPFSFEGESKPFSKSRETHLDVDVQDIDLARYVVYIPTDLKGDLRSALLDLNLRFKYDQPDEGQTLTLSGRITLKNLDLVEEDGGPVLNLPKLEITLESFALFRQRLHIAKTVFQAPELHLRRNRQKVLNLTEVWGTPKEKPPGRPGSKKKPSPLTVELDELRLNDGTVTFADLGFQEPFRTTVKGVQLVLKNFSNVQEEQGRLSLGCRLDEKGKVEVEGDVCVRPPSADLNIKLQGLELSFLQPYLQERLEAELTGGTLSVDGKFHANRTGHEPLTLAWSGELTLADFSATHEGKALVSWKRFALKGFDYGGPPARLNIRQASLEDYRAYVRIGPDGKLNLLELTKPAPPKEERAGGGKPPASAQSAAEAGKAAPTSGSGTAGAEEGKGGLSGGALTVTSLDLQGGRLHFVDDHLRKTVHILLADLGGAVNGLSSESGSEATVNVKGKVNGVAPLDIEGKAGPIGKKFGMDMKVALHGLDMTSLSPFVETYLGYVLEKGNLSLGLKYVIVKNRLDAQNVIQFDGFTLGNEVESPEAVSVPVKFALSVLKNRQGEIKLDVPVSGDLGNPQFHLSSVIRGGITGILVKAANSPFSILASLVDWKGPELSYVVFPYGSSGISGEAGAKLNKLAQALYERPEVKLEVTGYVNVEQDREALKADRLNTLLKKQKQKEQAKAGGPSKQLRNIRIAPDEYRKYLRMAYDAAEQAKRKNPASGQPTQSDLSPAELKKQLLSTIDVTREDLARLAHRRAEGVRRYILGQKKIDPARIFLVAPSSLAPEKKEGLKESRVVMGLQ